MESREAQEIEVRRGEVVVVEHTSHVQKVNVNTSIAWATSFAWGLGCRGGSQIGRGPRCTGIDKPHDDGVDAPPGAAELNSDAGTLTDGLVLRSGLRCWPTRFLSFLLDLFRSILIHCHIPVCTMAGVLKKYELEAKLKDEHKLIQQGILRDENPLDLTSDFTKFLGACRKGDLKTCQELISNGVNINGKDAFDYTPLIIASLCGHFELVQLLLESGTPLCDIDMPRRRTRC